jgi:hypothetical protein
MFTAVSDEHSTFVFTIEESQARNNYLFVAFFIYSLSLKMLAEGSSETSVSSYGTT